MFVILKKKKILPETRKTRASRDLPQLDTKGSLKKNNTHTKKFYT